MTPAQVLDVIANRLQEWPVRREPGALLIENLELRLTCTLDEACEPIGRCALISSSHPTLGRPHIHAVDCWFDNEPWAEGAEALTKLRLEWGEPPGYEAFRQSVIFNPTSLDEIPTTLVAHLPERT
jgi:hypothetical protein